MPSETILTDLMTTKEVAEIFGVSLLTIYTWRCEKDLPFIRIGGGGIPVIRFDPKQVREWAKQKNISTQQS